MMIDRVPLSLNRRDFLLAAGAGLSLAGFGVPSVFGSDDRGASELVPGKDKRLIVHTARPTIQLETPVELLDAEETSLDLLFVRNNQQPADSATLKPWPLDDWSIQVTGLVKQPVTIKAVDLAKMEQVEHSMVLQCSGNGRSLYAQAAKAKGTQWTRGGFGIVRFAGVLLSAILEKYQIDIDSKARFVAAEGRDEALPEKEDFEHSLPLEDVLARSMIALRLNGEPIPAVHGGPARLITPGYFGTMQIKWLTRLRFEADESSNDNHIPRYRVPRNPIKPGEAIEYTFANSKPNWRMKVKSVVFSPTPGSEVPANRELAVRGVAFNDGSARIDSVLISLDRGKSWKRSRLQRPSDPYAWYRWSSAVTLKPGRHEIWTRAVDALGSSQPLDGGIHWNPSGYEWNGVEKIPVIAVS